MSGSLACTARTKRSNCDRDLLRRRAHDVVVAGVDDDDAGAVGHDDALDEARRVGHLRAAEAAVDRLELGERRRQIPERMVELPTKTISPFGGGDTRSAASNAAMSFSHRSVCAAAGAAQAERQQGREPKAVAASNHAEPSGRIVEPVRPAIPISIGSSRWNRIRADLDQEILDGRPGVSQSRPARPARRRASPRTAQPGGSPRRAARARRQRRSASNAPVASTARPARRVKRRRAQQRRHERDAQHRGSAPPGATQAAADAARFAHHDAQVLRRLDGQFRGGEADQRARRARRRARAARAGPVARRSSVKRPPGSVTVHTLSARARGGPNSMRDVLERPAPVIDHAAGHLKAARRGQQPDVHALDGHPGKHLDRRCRAR